MSPTDPKDIEEMHTVPYLQAVGALMYLATATRPDIAYAVGVLARFSKNPGMAHWKAVKHLFCYLKGTLDLKLTYSPDPNNTELFTTYTDADHGGNPDNGRSTSYESLSLLKKTRSYSDVLPNFSVFLTKPS
jgi:hypothetical protein